MIWTSVLQMAVGVVVGAVGGRVLLAFMRRVPLPDEGMYTLRVLAGALVVYGLATVAHGSGFLAVFVAGVLFGHRARRGGTRARPAAEDTAAHDRTGAVEPGHTVPGGARGAAADEAPLRASFT